MPTIARRDRAFALLRETRGAVDPAIRRQAARALAGRAVDSRSARLLRRGQPVGRGAADRAARGSTPEDWLALLPRLGPAARALLRHRDDLDPEVQAGAEPRSGRATSCSKAAATPRPAPAPAPSRPSSEFADPRAGRPDRGVSGKRARSASAGRRRSCPAEPAEGFRWETGTDGILLWVEGAPRGPLVGQSIAGSPGRGQYGVDGQAAGAFEKRAPFRDARFSVAGDGPAAGDWRISGMPFFDPRRGSFLGYRGTARRPRLDEIARSSLDAAPPGVFGTQFPADSLRQLIHELRTPLNAIIGFAEMIEGQYMGPAAAPYRGRAAEIMEQARGLLGAVDDLDTAARIETRRLELDESAVDAVALLGRLHESYERVAAQRGARIDARDRARACRRPRSSRARPSGCSRGCSPARSAWPARARRSRAAMALAPRGEADDALPGGRPAARRSPGSTRPTCSIPATARTATGRARPALGLGFALRLVRNLAEAVGGALTIEPRASRSTSRSARRRGAPARRAKARPEPLAACHCRRAPPCHCRARGL